MALLGNIISRSLRIRKLIKIKEAAPIVYQQRTIKKLMEQAQYTAFGKKFNFESILQESLDLENDFKKAVPYYNYNSIFKEWWHRCLEGEPNVTWPGKVKYFALSSGTSESSSKYIPVTQDMLRSTKKVGFKQVFSLSNFNIPTKTFQKGILMLGGTTSLTERGDHYEGDMSGISAKNMPRLFARVMYKPGQKIAQTPDWEERIRMIVENAPKWDVGTLAGVPAWVQIVLEKVIETYKLKNIHELWPNLNVYIHGGVAFEPYRKNFKKLLGKDIVYIETYMSSEGSFGFQARPDTPGIKLVLNADIFYEFVPFNSENFNEDGDILPTANSYLIHEVKEHIDYAIVISTCAGAWRYIIGDVVQFTNVPEHEIIITGRTKQFLSLCGEHISVDNLNKAVDYANSQLDIHIKEFCVIGQPHDNLFAHHWFVGCDTEVDALKLKNILDQHLCEINDDYAVERTSALKEIILTVLPSHLFTDYLKYKGQYGAMNKFPRVMKGEKAHEWLQFLKSKERI